MPSSLDLGLPRAPNPNDDMILNNDAGPAFRSHPPHVANWLTGQTAVAERANKLVEVAPALSALQEAVFNVQQGRLAAVKTAESAILKYHSDVRNRRRVADAAYLASLEAAVTQVKTGLASDQANTHAVTAISAGTREVAKRVDKLLNELAGAQAEVDFARVTFKGSPGDVISAQRRVLDDVDDEAEAIRRAPIPQADRLAAALADLDATAARGRLRVDSKGGVIWPENPLAAMPVLGRDGVMVPSDLRTIDGQAMLAALHRDALAAQIEAIVREQYKGVAKADQLTSAQRKAKLADVAARRLEAELVEHAAVFAAWASGDLRVGLRLDADARAVLGIRSWKATAKSDSRGSLARY